MTAGGTGTVTIQGTGGNTSGSGDFGVYVNGVAALVTATGGNISVTGAGGGSTTVGIDIDTGAAVTAPGATP